MRAYYEGDDGCFGYLLFSVGAVRLFGHHLFGDHFGHDRVDEVLHLDSLALYLLIGQDCSALLVEQLPLPARSPYCVF